MMRICFHSSCVWQFWRILGLLVPVLDVSRRLACTVTAYHNSHLSRPGGTRSEDLDDDADALVALQPALLRPTSPWTSILIHRGQASSWDLSSCVLARAFSKSSLPHKPFRTGRQTPSKVRSQRSHKELQFVFVIWRNDAQKSVDRKLMCLLRWIKDQQRDMAVDWQVFYLIRQFAGPFSFLEFACCNPFLPGLPCHSTANPHWLCRKRSMLFRVHVLESPWVSHGSDEICWCFWDLFFLGVNYAHFMERKFTEFHPGLFPTPTQLHLSFSPLSLAVHSLE